MASELQDDDDSAFDYYENSKYTENKEGRRQFDKNNDVLEKVDDINKRNKYENDIDSSVEENGEPSIIDDNNLTELEKEDDDVLNLENGRLAIARQNEKHQPLNKQEQQRISRLLPNNKINHQSSSYRRYPSSSLKFQNYHRSRFDAAIDNQRQKYQLQQHQQLKQKKQQQQQQQYQQYQQHKQTQHQAIQLTTANQQNSQLRLRTSSKINQQFPISSAFNSVASASAATSLKYQLQEKVDSNVVPVQPYADADSETQILSLSPKFPKVKDFVKTKSSNTRKVAIGDQLSDDHIKNHNQHQRKKQLANQQQNLNSDKESHEARLNQKHQTHKASHNHLPRSIDGEDDNLRLNIAPVGGELNREAEEISSISRSATAIGVNSNDDHNHLQINNVNNILNSRNTNSLNGIPYDNSVGIQPLAGGAFAAPITTIIALSLFGIVLIGVILAVWLKKLIFKEKEHNKTPTILNFDKSFDKKNKTETYLIHRKSNDKPVEHHIFSDAIVDIKKTKNNFIMADDLNNSNNRSPPYFTPIGTIDDNKFIFPTMVSDQFSPKTLESAILFSALSTPKYSSSAVTIPMQSTSSKESFSPPISCKFLEENGVNFTIGELKIQDKEKEYASIIATNRKEEKTSRSKGRPILLKSLSTTATAPASIVGRKQSSQPTTPSTISQYSPSALTSPPHNNRLRRFSQHDRRSYSPQRSTANTSGGRETQTLKRLTKLRNDDNNESFERMLQISPTPSCNAISSSNSSQTTIVSNVSETTSYRQQQRSAAGGILTSPKIYDNHNIHDDKENAAPFGDLNSPKMKVTEHVFAQQNSPHIFESPTAIGTKFSFSPKRLSNNIHETQQNQITIASPIINNIGLQSNAINLISSPLLSSAICRQGDYFKFPEVDCLTPQKAKSIKKMSGENVNISSETKSILLSPTSDFVINKNNDNEPHLRPTMATRRARLKSISLDSDGARLVEDNLGVPVEELIEIANQTQNLHDDCFMFDNNNCSTYYSNRNNLINTTISAIDFATKTVASNSINLTSTSTAAITATTISDIITPSLIDISQNDDRKFQSIEKSKSKNKNHLTIEITKEQQQLTNESLITEGDGDSKQSTNKTPKTPKTPILSSKQKAFSLDSSDSSQFSHMSGHSLSSSATTSFAQISSMPATPKHNLRQQQQRLVCIQQNISLSKPIGNQQNSITRNLLLNRSAPRIDTEEIEQETPANFATNNISGGYLLQYRKSGLTKAPKSSKYLSSHQTKSSSVMTSSSSTPSSSFDQTKSFDRNSSSNFISKLGSFNENTYDDDYCDYYNYILDGDGRIVVVEEHDDDQYNVQIDEDDSSSLSKDEKQQSQNRSNNECNLLGSNLQNQKSATNLSVSNNNLKTLPEVMTLSDFSVNTDDEECKMLIKNNNTPIIINRTPRNSILQRRGSNHSLTLNLNGSYGNLTKGLSISNYSLGSNSQYNLCGSTANISAQQSKVKVPIIEGDVIDLEATSAFLVGGGCIGAAGFSGSENNRKNLLQRRGSNTSLTLNIRGSSSMNLNRFNSHSSLNITAQQQQLHHKLAHSQASSIVGSSGHNTKKGLLERRNSNTSLTLNIQTRGLSISNVNLRGSACSLNSVSTNPTDFYEPHAIIIDENHMNAESISNSGVINMPNDIENYSSSTGGGGSGVTYQNRRRFLSSENLNSMTQCSKLNQTHIRNSTKTCFGSVSDLKPTYQNHQQPSSSKACLTNKSQAHLNQSLIQDEDNGVLIGDGCGFVGNVGGIGARVLGKEHNNFEKPLSLKKSNIRSNISRFDFSNLDKPIADERYSTFEQGTLCSCTGVRNITTRPLSPQTTSEDFKMYLANIQLLQNASNVLNADHLRKLNYVFEKSYSDNNSGCSERSSLTTDKKKSGKTLFDHGVLSTSDSVSNIGDDNENDVDNDIDDGDENYDEKLASDGMVENNFMKDFNGKDSNRYDLAINQKSTDIRRPQFQIPNSDEQKKLLIHLHQEFWDLPTNFQEKPMVFGSQAKNRYDSILPNEHSRVILDYEPGCQQEPYINANYIKGPDFTQNSYIATQGPMANTIYEYWLMIYQNINKFRNNNIRKALNNNKIETQTNLQITSYQKIIMLTDFIENNRQKCSVYFPIDKNDTYLISTTNDEITNNVQINDFYNKYFLNNNETENNYDNDDNDKDDSGDNVDDHYSIINHKESTNQMSNILKLPLMQSFNVHIDNETILKMLPKSNYFIIKTISVVTKNGYQIRKLVCLYCQNQNTHNNYETAKTTTTSNTTKNSSSSKFGRDQLIYRFICYHYWYPDWPDHRSPSDINVLLDISLHFLNNRCHDEFQIDDHLLNETKIYKVMPSSSTSVDNKANILFDNFELNFYNQPLPIIHCSAGIGRTGCFAAVLNGLRQMHSTLNPISPQLLQSVSIPSRSNCLAIENVTTTGDNMVEICQKGDIKNVINSVDVENVENVENSVSAENDVVDIDNEYNADNDSNIDNDNNDKCKETPSQSILKKYLNPYTVSELCKTTMMNNENQLNYCKKNLEMVYTGDKDNDKTKLNNSNATKSKTECASSTVALSLLPKPSRLKFPTNILNVDILGIVCNLRLQRGGMVQNSEQYELIHRALCLYLKQWDNT